MKLHRIVSFWIVAVIQWTYVEGECCSGAQHGWFMAMASGHGTSTICHSWCCGCGACNIFCCNCADGCNKGWWNYWKGATAGHRARCGHKKKRKIDSFFSYSKARELFDEVDADGSLNITIDEADKYLKSQYQFKRETTFTLRDEIEKMDENKDGIISSFEFDSSLHF